MPSRGAGRKLFSRVARCLASGGLPASCAPPRPAGPCVPTAARLPALRLRPRPPPPCLQGYKPPEEGPGEYQTIPLDKIEDFGVHAKQASEGVWLNA